MHNIGAPGEDETCWLLAGTRTIRVVLEFWVLRFGNFQIKHRSWRRRDSLTIPPISGSINITIWSVVQPIFTIYWYDNAPFKSWESPIKLSILWLQIVCLFFVFIGEGNLQWRRYHKAIRPPQVTPLPTWFFSWAGRGYDAIGSSEFFFRKSISSIELLYSSLIPSRNLLCGQLIFYSLTDYIDWDVKWKGLSPKCPKSHFYSSLSQINGSAPLALQVPLLIL